MPLIGHEKWMTNINSDHHYVQTCVLESAGRRVRACAHWYLYAETWKHKLKVYYLFFSLIAEITVYFQTAVRCGELAWLSEHTQRTEGATWREGVGGINGRWVGAEEFSSFLSEDSFQRIKEQRQKRNVVSSTSAVASFVIPWKC